MSKARWLTYISGTVGAVLALCAPSLSAQAPDLRARVAANHLEYIPSGDGPFPTVVAVPGCSGIAFPDPIAEANHPNLREDDRLFRRHYPEAAERLRTAGFAVLLLNVQTAEGLVTACSGQLRPERIAEYITEAVAWAGRLRFVDPARLYVAGWSMGGRGVLTWLNSPASRTTEARAVIGVYAGCQDQERLTTHVPLLLLMGGADDIAAPSVCEALLAQSPSSTLIDFHVYPGARHGFDATGAPPVLEIGDGLTIGYQQEAAQTAWAEIFEFLN